MYQTLYRTYRPKTFDEVLGQKQIIKTLKNQVKSGNLSHAYLFTGERGTGKTSTAKILARAVNCENPRDGNPCNECESCRRILNEETMDILEMDAASNRTISDIRELKEMVLYPPQYGKYKCYIIDEVHMLTNEAFNALLKTLEEPPEFLIFILATTQPEKLPDTILSRCQRFDFRRVSEKDLSLNIKNILGDLDRDIEPNALNMIVNRSGGSVRDSLSILERFISYSDKVITEEDAVFLFGSLSEEALFNLTLSVFKSDVQSLIRGLDDAQNDGKDTQILYRDLIEMMRSEMLVILLGDRAKDFLYFSDSAFNMIKEVSKYITNEKLERMLDVMIEKEAVIKRSSVPRILIETLLISFMENIEKAEIKEDLKPAKNEVYDYEVEPVYYGEESEVFIDFPEEIPDYGENKEKKPQIKEKKEVTVEKKNIEIKERVIDKEIEKDIKTSNNEELSVKDDVMPEKEILNSWQSVIKKIKQPAKTAIKNMKVIKVSNNTIFLDKTGCSQNTFEIALPREKISEFEGLLSSMLGAKINIRFEENKIPKEVDDEKEITEYFEENTLKKK